MWATLALSVLAHALLWVWLHWQKQIPASAKHGVVSVDFVASVSHETRPRTKPKSDTVNPHPMKTETPPSAEPPQPQADPAAVAGAAQTYGLSIMTLVGRKKIYPQEAIDREQEGKVVIGLTLDRAGLVTAANLEEPSQFQILNEAAMKTVQAVGQFPPVPDLLSVPLHLHVPIVYRIERN